MGVSAFYRSYWDGRAYRSTKIYQHDHTFLFGDVVRWTGTEWVLASAKDSESSEGIGVVSHSGYRGENGAAATAEYARRALPSFAASHQTQTQTQCNDPRHYFSVVFRGEITVPDQTDINYSAHALLSGTQSVPEPYTPGRVYYLSPFEEEHGKLIGKSPIEFGGKMASSVVKPMLVALDHRRAIVVNYIGSVLENNHKEWTEIQNVQRVGAIGAFLETSIPDSWLPCDGRLCTAAQYPQLAELIGGSVRVSAHLRPDQNAPQADTFTAISTYSVLDFSDENIDVSAAVVGQPLLLRQENSSSQAEITALVDGVIDSKTLRVILSGVLEGNTQVRVRAPWVPGLDSMFFVPNLRNRTVKGADPIAVHQNTNKQSDVGDYSGSNTATLNTGADIAAGTGYSATVDVRADAAKVVFAIKTSTVDCGEFINNCCAPVEPVGKNDNVIVNGAFLVWQRGDRFMRDTFDAQPQYTADRWFEDFSIPEPIAPTLGQYHALKRGVRYTKYNPASVSGETDLPDDITTYAQVQGTLMTATSASGVPTTYTPSTELLPGLEQESYHYLENRIEDVRTLSGESTVLSFWARGTEPGSVYVSLRQHFAGTRGILDDAYSRPVQIEVDGTPGWQKYEIQFDIPDVQDTKPSNGFIGGNSFLGAQFWTMYFAGSCAGTPNPIVYDAVMQPTPGPETEGVPLPVLEVPQYTPQWPQEVVDALNETFGIDFGKTHSIEDGVIVSLNAEGEAEEIIDATRVIVFQYAACCGSLCNPCSSNNVPNHQCCSGWVIEVGQREPLGTVCGEVSIFSGTIEGGACCVVPKFRQKTCCQGPPPAPSPGGQPPLLPPLETPPGCACRYLDNWTRTFIPFTGHPNSTCFNAGGFPGENHPSRNGGCLCSGGSYPSFSAFTDAVCECCSCGPQPWGSEGGGPEPTDIPPTPCPEPTIPPPPTASPPPPSPSPPAPSPSTSVPSSPPPTVPPTPPNSPSPTPSIPTTEPPVTVSPSVLPPSASPSPGPPHECVTNCCLPVLFTSNFNYTGTLHITGVQLLRGKQSTPFAETQYLSELKKCQRYYERDEEVPVGGFTQTGVSANFVQSINYMVAKRKLKAPCVRIQGYYNHPDAFSVCSLNTAEAECFTTDSATFRVDATPRQAAQGLCAALLEYEIDVDLYESPCPNDPPCDTPWVCAWREVS